MLRAVPKVYGVSHLLLSRHNDISLTVNNKTYGRTITLFPVSCFLQSHAAIRESNSHHLDLILLAYPARLGSRTTSKKFQAPNSQPEFPPPHQNHNHDLPHLSPASIYSTHLFPPKPFPLRRPLAPHPRNTHRTPSSNVHRTRTTIQQPTGALTQYGVDPQAKGKGRPPRFACASRDTIGGIELHQGARRPSCIGGERISRVVMAGTG
jgi:hypothetical protein